jgi:Zn-finger protein
MIYDQILLLKENDEIKKTDKGYLFEQLIREIQPWSFKPPIVTTTKTEQLDGVYNWNGNTFLIECKAKEKVITGGSSDWEDFELKVQKRKGTIVGLFCSLYSVDDSVIEAATDLNKAGMTTIVLSDKFWGQLNEERIDFSIVLNYLVLYARARFKPDVSSVKTIKKWYYNKEENTERIYNLFINKSSTFLSRFRRNDHDKLYVDRDIDRKIVDFARQLKPSLLKKRYKDYQAALAKNTDAKFKDLPNQFFLLRDASGAGKTFFSIQNTLLKKDFVAIGKAASQNDIDNIGASLLELGNDYGINEIESIDKPVIILIDSLDEAMFMPNKHREVRAIFELVNEKLKSLALKNKMCCFPIGVVYTIREDYWREWESDFEGRKLTSCKKAMSIFNSSELDTAIQNYSTAFNYKITSEITDNIRRVLSIPINLLIFSEANEYKGEISINEIWEESVLYNYFLRKKENVLKRNIQALTPTLFLNVCCDLAYAIIENRNNSLEKKDVYNRIKGNFTLVESLFDEIVRLLISERILSTTPDNKYVFRFKHNKFIEYLSAFYILWQTDKTGDFSKLELFAETIFSSGIASMFKVHGYIIYIAGKEYPQLVEQVDKYYANNTKFMKKSLRKLRSEIAEGFPSEDKAIELILKKCGSKDPEVTMNSFFVIAARNNNPSKKSLIETFKNAWDNNEGKHDRWKLIPKLAIFEALPDSDVVSRIFQSATPKEWEVYLGNILEYDLNVDFKQIWQEMEGDCRFIKHKYDDDWTQVLKLIDIILNDKPYILGE